MKNKKFLIIMHGYKECIFVNLFTLHYVIVLEVKKWNILKNHIVLLQII